MIPRVNYRKRVQTGLRWDPVVALVELRQCGRTTLASEFLTEGSSLYFDLEDPVVSGPW